MTGRVNDFESPGYALFVRSALAGNMGFCIGKTILAYMYVLRHAVREWRADI